jgi:DNA-binding transcriptional ArsR family regulator
MSIERNSHPSTPGEPQEDSGDRQHELRELTDARQMRALAHPIRIALLEALTLEGPLTATQVGAIIGESSTTCSFHLRQLAKYGFVEEAGRGPGRVRPWRLTHVGLRFSNVSPDAEQTLAASALQQILNQHYLTRLQAWLEVRNEYPSEWLDVTGTSESIFYVTPQELHTLRKELETLLLSYRERLTDPSQRPADALPIEALLFLFPSRPPKKGES